MIFGSVMTGVVLILQDFHRVRLVAGKLRNAALLQRCPKQTPRNTDGGGKRQDILLVIRTLELFHQAIKRSDEYNSDRTEQRKRRLSGKRSKSEFSWFDKSVKTGIVILVSTSSGDISGFRIPILAVWGRG